MSNASDFIIENGVLTKYVGSGGTVVVPDGITIIGRRTFSGCSNLTSITIPDGVTSIRSEAFRNCRSLTIHAPAGSYAETYAKEHNIPFVAE